MKKYDVFISYRRDGGSETAKLIRDSLTEKGYKVFLDVESLRSGPFNTELYSVIENSKDFLLILPENSLDRCANEGDWLRLEIEHAQRCGKNIVPIMLKGFSFPQVLPESIDFIRTQNGIAANMDYFDAFIKHIEKFLRSRHRLSKSKRWIPAVAALVLVAAIVFGCFKYFTRYPRNAAQRTAVTELIAYMSPNLAAYDLATSEYKSLLDKAKACVNGSDVYTFEDLDSRLETGIEKMSTFGDEITAMPDDLRKMLIENDYNDGDVGDLKGFPTFLSARINDYSESLKFIKTYLQIINNSSVDKYKNIQKEILLRLLERYETIADLESELVFYNINETFLPVNVESALHDLKKEILPRLTCIYEKRHDFIDDLETLRGKEDAIEEKINELTEEIGEDIKTFREYVNEETAKYKNSNQTDDGEFDWYKALDFLAANDPDSAAEIFKDIAKEYKGTGMDDYYAYLSAYRYAKNYNKHGIKGAALILGFKEGAEHQAVEVGDILFEVNGTRVTNVTEFVDAGLKSGNVFPIKLLRFSKDGYEIVESVYDRSIPVFRLMPLARDPDDETESTN